jgi:hypothetical protein
MLNFLIDTSDEEEKLMKQKDKMKKEKKMKKKS